jgi:hypothetical protein
MEQKVNFKNKRKVTINFLGKTYEVMYFVFGEYVKDWILVGGGNIPIIQRFTNKKEMIKSVNNYLNEKTN